MRAMSCAPLALLLALGATLPGPARAAAPTNDGQKVLKEALAIKQVTLPVAADPTVSFKVAFRVGSQDDPAGKEGLAALTAQMMAAGSTKKHTYAQILELLYPMAAGYDVTADKELTTFDGRVHKDNLAAYTDLLLDAIRQPDFNESDFQRLKQQAQDYIEKRLRYSSDEELGKQTLHTTVFAGTPYGHITTGTSASLAAITLDDVRKFYAAHYTRDNIILGLGGGFDNALSVQMTNGLASLPAGAPPQTPPSKAAAINGRPVTIVQKPGQSTAISFGFPVGVKRGQRDFYALWMANSWLGEHRNSSSHLYQFIREARGMNYGDYSYIEVFPGGGFRTMPPTNVPRRTQLFEVWLRPVPNEQAHFALRAGVSEVEKLAQNGLSEEQFELTKTFLTKYCLHFAETTSDRLGYAVDDAIYEVPSPGNLANFRNLVPKLTREEVNAAIKKYLNPANMQIAIVTEKADELAAALASDKPSPMTYATPKPQSVLDEDKYIEKYPLHITKESIKIVPVDQMFAK